MDGSILVLKTTMCVGAAIVHGMSADNSEQTTSGSH